MTLNSPHTGRVGDVSLRLGCFLPLSETTFLLKKLGYFSWLFFSILDVADASLWCFLVFSASSVDWRLDACSGGKIRALYLFGRSPSRGSPLLPLALGQDVRLRVLDFQAQENPQGGFLKKAQVRRNYHARPTFSNVGGLRSTNIPPVSISERFPSLYTTPSPRPGRWLFFPL